jgi:hypothetical protein
MARFSLRGDRYAWLIVFLSILPAILLMPKRARIRGDGVFYYAYLPALCLDHTLDLRSQYQQYPHAWLQSYWVDLNVPGRPRNWFPIGPAMLWSPFFLLGQEVAKLAGDTGTPPGYSAYQFAFVFAGTLLYALAGLLILYRILKDYFSPPVAFLSVTGIWLATFLIYYSTIDASYSHALDFFMACVVLQAWLAWRKEPERIARGIGLGILIALAALVRWQSLALFLFPASDLLSLGWARRPVGPAKSFRIAASRLLLISVVAVGVFFAVQNPVWKVVNGQGILSFGLRGDWKNPFFWNALFSARNGLFTWTPIAWFCVAGFVLLIRREPRLASVFLVFFAFQVYISTVHGVWYGGDSYGARRLSSALPMLAFGLGAFLELAFSKRVVKLALAVIAALILWNLGLMADYYTDAQPHDRALSFMGVVKRRYHDIGDPLSFPANWIFALRYHLPPERYDVVVGNYFFPYGTLGTGIEFGNPAYRPFLVDGWSPYEARADALWAEGTRSRILLPLYRTEDCKFLFQVYPFSDPALARDQTMELKVNGASVGKRTLPRNSAWSLVEFEIPRRVERRGVSELELDYAYAASPLELGSGSDSRKLSVRFRQLEIARVFNFADPFNRPFLIEGWGRYEAESDALWAEGTRSRILLPLFASRDYRLRFEVRPFTPPNFTGEQTVELRVNGASVGTRMLAADSGWTTIEFEVPARVQAPAGNELELNYGYASTPSGVAQGSSAEGPSIQFRRLEIVPEFSPLSP